MYCTVPKDGAKRLRATFCISINKNCVYIYNYIYVMYHRTGSRVRFYIVTMNSCFVCFPDEEDHALNNAGMIATGTEEDMPALAVANTKKSSKKSKKKKKAIDDDLPTLVKGEDGMSVIPL